MPRPSVALVVIFGFGESHIGKIPFLFLLYKAWANGVRVPLVWFMTYKVERGKVYFQCGTLQSQKWLQVQHFGLGKNCPHNIYYIYILNYYTSYNIYIYIYKKIEI